MKKTFLTLTAFLLTKSLDKEGFDKLEAEKQSELYNELTENNAEALKEMAENNVSKEELQKAIAQMNADNIEHNKVMNKHLIDLGLEMKANREKGFNFNEKPTLATELKANMSAIKALSPSDSTSEVVIKADTVRASITDNAQAYEIPTIGQLATRKLSLYDMFPKITLGTNNNGTVRYYDWDEETTVRAAASRAEGALFPESTAKWKTYTLPLQKIGDTLPVTEEFYEDEAMFASELENFLNTNVALVIDSQLSTGDGTSNTLKGLISSSTAFSATGLTKVEDAQFYDLLAVAPEQITVTGGAKYQPNFVVMNKRTINKMRLTKDLNENYIIPPFVDRDGKVVDSMVVMESNVIPNNALVLGDSRFAKIYEKPGVAMSKWMPANQFLEDMETIKVRKRLLFLIRNADKGGFIYISDIDAAIAAITLT